jgi:hypothetical protein
VFDGVSLGVQELRRTLVGLRSDHPTHTDPDVTTSVRVRIFRAMTITGAHALLYSSEPEALRAILQDVFGWKHVDAGGGWLIFALPPAEVGVHPAERPSHQLSLMCDDITATMADLRAKGIEFRGESHDEGFGVTATMILPGGVELMLYEPRHPTAI